MPKDQWARANARARYGPTRRTEDAPKKRQQKTGGKTYAIEAGVPCRVRRVGETEWMPHTTTVKQTLYGVAWSPGYLVFRRGGYQMMIAVALIRKAKKQ